VRRRRVFFPTTKLVLVTRSLPVHRSIFFLCFPFVINASLAFYIFTYEHETNPAFLTWSNRNVKIAPIFTVLAAADIETLNVLASRLAGLRYFCAPISDRSLGWIFWTSTLNVFLEDIPQLIIQVC
jgi:hypothetical protein